MAQFGRVPPIPSSPSSSDEEMSSALHESPPRTRVWDSQEGSSRPLDRDSPEGSRRFVSPRLRYYDITTQRHRLWEGFPPTSRFRTGRPGYSYPDRLVREVERERDHLLDERVGLVAQTEQLQLETQRQQVLLARARTAAENAQAKIRRLNTETTGFKQTVKRLEDGLEFVEDRQRDAVLEMAMLRAQVRARDESIAELERQMRDRDDRLAEGRRRARRTVEALETGENVTLAPESVRSQLSVQPRRRVYEPLEGSSAGPTDPIPDDDDVEAAANDARGTRDGDSAGTPAISPGWCV